MRSPHFGQGSNSANVRRYNERLLLKTLRRAGSASKADLARLASMTGTAVGSIIASLADARLIEFAGRTEGQRGQHHRRKQLARTVALFVVVGGAVDTLLHDASFLFFSLLRFPGPGAH